MKRRTLLQSLALLAPAILLGRHLHAAETSSAITPWTKPPVHGALLAPEAYAVLFEDDTERANSSPLNHEKRDGTFVCAACYLPLFNSQDKFDSGTGWPSFTQPIAGHTAFSRDFKLIIPRTEYHCARCGGHQGTCLTMARHPAVNAGATTASPCALFPKLKTCRPYGADHA